MYVTPRQKKRYLLNALIITVAIPLTVVAGYYATQLLSSADEEAVPENVVVSNLTTNSLTVTWTTSIDASGEVVVKDSEGEDSRPYIDFRGSGSRKTHFVEVLDLVPATK